MAPYMKAVGKMIKKLDGDACSTMFPAMSTMGSTLMANGMAVVACTTPQSKKYMTAIGAMIDAKAME